MRVDRRPQGTQTQRHVVQREPAEGAKGADATCESGRQHRFQWRHPVPLLGRAADIQAVEPERFGDFRPEELVE